MSLTVNDSYVLEIVNAIEKGIQSSRGSVQGIWTDRDHKIATIAAKEAVKAWAKYHRDSWFQSSI
jgi:hypothetical protein